MGVPFCAGYVMPHSVLGLIVEENRKEKSQVKNKYIKINDNIGVWGWTKVCPFI
jgi:hypothetical protein